MPQRLVYFNGEFVPEREARISIFDSSLMFGDMVFEMTRSFNQKPYKLREHLVRLFGSMRYAEIDCGLTIDQMEAATLATVDRNLPALEGFDTPARREHSPAVRLGRGSGELRVRCQGIRVLDFAIERDEVGFGHPTILPRISRRGTRSTGSIVRQHPPVGNMPPPQGASPE